MKVENENITKFVFGTVKIAHLIFNRAHSLWIALASPVNQRLNSSKIKNPFSWLLRHHCITTTSLMYSPTTVDVIKACYSCLGIRNSNVDLRLACALTATLCYFTVYDRMAGTSGGQESDHRTYFFLRVWLQRNHNFDLRYSRPAA